MTNQLSITKGSTVRLTIVWHGGGAGSDPVNLNGVTVLAFDLIGIAEGAVSVVVTDAALGQIEVVIPSTETSTWDAGTWKTFRLSLTVSGGDTSTSDEISLVVT